MYEKLQQIAVKDGARTHHISQKVQISPTVIKLVQFALDNIDRMVSDSNGNISDNLSDIGINSLPDKANNLSDISDKRIEAIVDKRLAELGLLPICQTEDNSTDHSLPDKVENVPDSLSDNSSDKLSDKIDEVPDRLSDKDVIISDRVTLLSDSLSDTKNIPSNDPSNSAPIAEEVQIIPTEAIDRVDEEVPESLSWGDFHKRLGLPTTGKPSKAKGDKAIAKAEEKGHGDWVMNSSNYQFTKSTKE